MLRLLTLGGLTVQNENGPLGGSAAQPRRLALLAYVARNGARGALRSQVIALLWPDADDEQGRRVLSQALYALRRDLGREQAIVGKQELRLNPRQVWCDVAAFETLLANGDLADAAALYAGHFLEGFRLANAPEFERWADDERTAIRHRYHDAVEQLARAAELEGAIEAAVKWWRRRAADDPLNARVAMAVMRALAAAGDHVGALRQAGVFEALIAEELDLPPDRAVTDLAQALRREAISRAPTLHACVAVLPFAVFGGADAGVQEEWVNGLAEECINVLTHIPGLRVAARSATQAFGPTPVLAALASDLGATIALEGSIRFGAPGVRVTARLIDVARGHTVWSARYDCAAADPHAAHDQIAAQIGGRARLLFSAGAETDIARA